MKSALSETVQVLQGFNWSYYVELEDEFVREDFNGFGQLHKPLLKYSLDFVKIIADDEKNDQCSLLDHKTDHVITSLKNPTETLGNDRTRPFAKICRKRVLENRI